MSNKGLQELRSELRHRKYDPLLAHSYWKEWLRLNGYPENLELKPLCEIESQVIEFINLQRQLGRDVFDLRSEDVPEWARHTKYTKPDHWLKNLYKNM